MFRLAAIATVVLVWEVTASAQPPCKVGDLLACPAGQFCSAYWQDGKCPTRGTCRSLLPVPRELVFSLPVPAGERVYCAKGTLRAGSSTHSACDPATRFALDLSGTAADRPHFVLAAADGVAHVFGGCATRDLNRQEAPDPCNYGFGNLVRIDHGRNVYSQAAHLSSILVKDGQFVRRGDVLGIEGNTGNAGAKHIHWSLHLGSPRVRLPGPTVPFARIRFRSGGQVRTASAFALRCGDFEHNPLPVPETLLESENRLRKLPPARFGYLSWFDDLARSATDPDPRERRRAIARLRDRYDDPTAPYWIGVAYLMSGDLQTARDELERALRRSDSAEAPAWLRPWCLIMLGELALADRRHWDARNFFEDALATPGDDSTGFRARARTGLNRVNNLP